MNDCHVSAAQALSGTYVFEAGDAERRRLERDLHDGAQSRLVALAIKLRLARRRAQDQPELAALLDESSAELQASLDELRELARGIHPAVLTDRGLGPALEMLANRAPVAVEIAGDVPGDLPAPVATAFYFVASEALANVAKYASAERAIVTVERGADRMVPGGRRRRSRRRGTRRSRLRPARAGGPRGRARRPARRAQPGRHRDAAAGRDPAACTRDRLEEVRADTAPLDKPHERPNPCSRTGSGSIDRSAARSASPSRRCGDCGPCAASSRYDGSLKVRAGRAAGELTIEAGSLDTGHSRRDEHLCSPAFFDVERHPRIVFAATVVTAREGRLTITGELAIGASRVRPRSRWRSSKWPTAHCAWKATTTVSREAAGLAWNKLGMIRGDAVLHARITLEQTEESRWATLMASLDRVEIEALRGEFTDAVMMRDYDRLASLFTQDGAVRMPDIDAEATSREEIRAGIERMQESSTTSCNTHPGHDPTRRRHRARPRSSQSSLPDAAART